MTGGGCGRFGEVRTFTLSLMRLPRPNLRRIVAGALLLPALAACDSITGPDDLDTQERQLQRAWQRRVYPIARQMGVPIKLPTVS